MNGLIIENVVPGSPADYFDLQPGDRLLAINGHLLRDIIDYSYHCGLQDELVLEVARQDGELWELELACAPGESPGLIFSAPEPRRCGNNCLFCFVHQLPPGLRRQLYVKDEDYRLSFLNGTYVTLSNLAEQELARIIEQRLSPLYISVHATNPDLRRQLLGRSNIPPILDQLRALAAAGIRMHTQIVLCPGLNDGQELERTVMDLAELHPAVASLAIVPLGLTRHRRGLPRLSPADSDYARRFIAEWLPLQARLKKRCGSAFAQLADEFYLKAGLPCPPLRHYGQLPQLENGVGLLPLFLSQARRTLRQARFIGSFRVTIATGTSAFPFVDDFARQLGQKTGVETVVVPVENRLFGNSVTVTGLVSGDDIRSALKERDLGHALLLPEVMLKEGEGVFLDDVTPDELGRDLGVPVIPFEPEPLSYYRALRLLAQRGKGGHKKSQ